MKKETLLVVGLIVGLSGALCVVSSALVVVLVLQRTPAPAPALPSPAVAAPSSATAAVSPPPVAVAADPKGEKADKDEPAPADPKGEKGDPAPADPKGEKGEPAPTDPKGEKAGPAPEQPAPADPKGEKGPAPTDAKGEKGPAPAQPGPSAEEWTTKNDPSGFKVDLPTGWKAELDKPSGRVVMTGARGESIAAWPVFVPGALDAAGAASVLAKLAAKVAPDVTWADADSPTARVARLVGRSDRCPRAVALLAWVPSPEGAAARVFVVLVPKDGAPEETVARILGSFRATGAAIPADRPEKLVFARWMDPVESAFYLDVPKTWKTSGGLKRFAPTEVRGSVVTRSPEEDVVIIAGDTEVPTFSEPTRLGMSLGFTEGKWYSPGGISKMMIRRYVPGLAFVKDYVQQKVAKKIDSFEFVKERERPDVVAVLSKPYEGAATPGQKTTITAGEVAFKGKIGGKNVVGSYLAATLKSSVTVPGTETITIWNVSLLYGYVAVESKCDVAVKVLDRMIRTFESNPEWVKMQQGITAESVKIAHETNEEISKKISDGYWGRQASLSEISRRRSNATLGVEDVVDGTTGRELKVESGSNYYWLDDRGTIIGTDTSGAPSIEFRELIRRP